MKETINYDIIIVGTGAAGLFHALCLPPQLKVLMITKDQLCNSDSYLAQGGISTLLDETDYPAYYEDTLKAGHYENNRASVDIMIRSSKEIIQDLMGYGVVFDKDEAGNLAYTREGAHSTYRILHHEDTTGKEITSKLINKVQQRSNITLLEYTTMVDLIEKNNHCYGIITKDANGFIKDYYGKHVVLATGGLGGLFQNSTNFPHITGDSFALAMAHSIELENINYIQIHPTVLYSKKKGRRFLISESVRGEGGLLLNKKGQRFVDELLPRDVVTNAIWREMEHTGMDHVYLSMTHLEKSQIAGRFPNIYRHCLEEGYDLSKEPIPVTPAQHYLMGGIKASTYGETSMAHLYAIGETACNGVHGANRLASNSLLESLVFAKRAAGKIQESLLEEKAFPKFYPAVLIDLSKYEDEEARQKLHRKLVLDEIKRKDEEFYVKWCKHANSY